MRVGHAAKRALQLQPHAAVRDAGGLGFAIQHPFERFQLQSCGLDECAQFTLHLHAMLGAGFCKRRAFGELPNRGFERIAAYLEIGSGIDDRFGAVELPGNREQAVRALRLCMTQGTTTKRNTASVAARPSSRRTRLFIGTLPAPRSSIRLERQGETLPPAATLRPRARRRTRPQKPGMLASTASTSDASGASPRRLHSASRISIREMIARF